MDHSSPAEGVSVGDGVMEWSYHGSRYTSLIGCRVCIFYLDTCPRGRLNFKHFKFNTTFLLLSCNSKLLLYRYALTSFILLILII